MEKAAAKKPTATKTPAKAPKKAQVKPKTKAKALAQPKKIGAPTKYSEALADEICTRISAGKALVKICPELGIGIVSVWTWLDKYPDFLSKYVRAREVQADVLADEIVAIADELEIEAKHQGETVTLDVSATAVQRNRLRVDARKWYASKVAPKKYGDKLDTTVSGPDGGPVQVQVRMSDAERAVKLAYLLDKIKSEKNDANNK